MHWCTASALCQATLNRRRLAKREHCHAGRPSVCLNLFEFSEMTSKWFKFSVARFSERLSFKIEFVYSNPLSIPRRENSSLQVYNQSDWMNFCQSFPIDSRSFTNSISSQIKTLSDLYCLSNAVLLGPDRVLWIESNLKLSEKVFVWKKLLFSSSHSQQKRA